MMKWAEKIEPKKNLTLSVRMYKYIYVVYYMYNIVFILCLDKTTCLKVNAVITATSHNLFHLIFFLLPFLIRNNGTGDRRFSINDERKGQKNDNIEFHWKIWNNSEKSRNLQGEKCHLIHSIAEDSYESFGYLYARTFYWKLEQNLIHSIKI